MMLKSLQMGLYKCSHNISILELIIWIMLNVKYEVNEWWSKTTANKSGKHNHTRIRQNTNLEIKEQWTRLLPVIPIYEQTLEDYISLNDCSSWML